MNIFLVKTANDLQKLSYNNRITFVCENCGKEYTRIYRKNNVLLCKKCRTDITRTAKDGKDWAKKHTAKVKKHLLEKYGVENVSKLENVKKKKEATFKEKYGGFTLQSPTLKNRVKDTCIAKYGVDSPLKSVYVKNKIRKTVEERYGVSNIGESKDIHKKGVKTSYIKNNGDFCSKDTLKKRVETNRKKYGVDWVLQAGSVKDKIEKTCIARYGVAHPMQSDSFLQKNHHRFNYDGSYFDSCWELAFWIYCKDHNLYIERNTQGFKMKNGKYCFPDFKVSDGLLEIKGDYLVNQPDWKFKEELYKEKNITVLFFNGIKKYIRYILDTKSDEFIDKYNFRRYNHVC